MMAMRSKPPIILEKPWRWALLLLSVLISSVLVTRLLRLFYLFLAFHIVSFIEFDFKWFPKAKMFGGMFYKKPSKEEALQQLRSHRLMFGAWVVAIRVTPYVLQYFSRKRRLLWIFDSTPPKLRLFGSRRELTVVFMSSVAIDAVKDVLAANYIPAAPILILEGPWQQSAGISAPTIGRVENTHYYHPGIVAPQ
uniref:Uncharacterized protein n=1 Tax=Chenopodium quinoa TaxID=63459 RepID=A0A803MZC2_CHEQI